jgi:hypothetical protein
MDKAFRKLGAAEIIWIDGKESEGSVTESYLMISLMIYTTHHILGRSNYKDEMGLKYSIFWTDNEYNDRILVVKCKAG